MDNNPLQALRDVRDVLNGNDGQETARRMCNAIIERALLHGGDDSVDTCRAMLSLCAVQSDNLEFWHRLAGSIRKAMTLIG